MAKKVCIIVTLLLIISTVAAVRVSPKLDFEESNGSGAAIRSDDTRYRVVKSSFTPEVSRNQNVEVICVSGNCNTNKPNRDDGLTADVVVHIKTNSDFHTVKNETTPVEPDIPVVVGVKSSGQNNRPYPSTYRSVVAPPTPEFLPSIPNILPPQSQVMGYGNVNYAQAFPIVDNVVNTFFETALEAVNRPREAFYPKGVRGSYNPVEFRKTYGNTWTPIRWSGSGIERRNAVPQWTPCTCQNPETHYNNIPYYQPPGVNGKVSPLV